MKKKIAAVLAAAMVLTLGSASVFAEENPAKVTATSMTVSVEGGFEVDELSSQVLAYYTEWIEEIMNEPDVKPAAVQGKDIEISVVLRYISPGSATPDSDGVYNVILNLSGYSAESVFSVVNFTGEGEWDIYSGLTPVDGKLVIDTTYPHLFGIIEYKPAGAAAPSAPSEPSAPSVTVTTSSTTVSVGGDFEVTIPSAEVQASYTEAIKGIISDSDIMPSSMQGKDVDVSIMLFDIKKGGATPDAEGYYYVPFEVATPYGNSVYTIVHFLDDGGLEYRSGLTPEAGRIVVGTKEFSIFGVIEYRPAGAVPVSASGGHTHFWQEYTVAATATTWGYTMSYCAGCGEQYAHDYVAPNGAVASPKTAETASMLPVLALVCAAGAVFCTRKSVLGR